MSEILLKAEDAKAASSHMTKAAAEAEAQFNSTRQRPTELASSFKGQTAQNFDAKFEQWRKNATDLITSLNDLATFLSKAADTIVQTDEEIANQLRG
jgi:WXG100 family type VII secretion target